MPELPEVETVARGLRESVLGRTIVSVRLGKTDFMDDPAAIERHLPGRRIDTVERYGKFMLLRMSAVAGGAPHGDDTQPAAFLVHLGMTGQIGPSAAAEPSQKHTHAWFLLDDGRELRYVDPRRFGRLAYLTKDLLAKELIRFGAEPLKIAEDEFIDRFNSRGARIKAMLLDQSVLRGVGNIYADESLWFAKIHPARVASSLSKAQLKTLRTGLQDILRKAIRYRGSSISDYFDAKGERGDYQRHHRAYGREGQLCSRCKAVIRRTIVAGRSSFYCPHCQPAPRGSRPLALPKRLRRAGKPAPPSKSGKRGKK